MFKLAEKTELNQVSLTGMRALIMLGLLIMRPHSLEEIKRALVKLNIMKANNSDDILRIDLNTLKIMGCEITRPAGKTEFRYTLTRHPFELKIEEFEINLLKRIYYKIKQTADVALLIEYHELFTKLASFIFNTNLKERLLGISALKYHDIPALKDLMLDCKQNRLLTLVYKNPTTPMATIKEIIAQNLIFQNDKVYLYAYDSRRDKVVVLNVRRINKILARTLQKSEIDAKPVRILFNLKEYYVGILEPGEMVVATENGGYLIEGSYYNEFIALQRMLSLGSNCTIIEPTEFKNDVVKKLKGIRKNYD